jgi:hypothetical protein
MKAVELERGAVEEGFVKMKQEQRVRTRNERRTGVA